MAQDAEKRFQRAMGRLFATDRSSGSCPATPAPAGSSARVCSPIGENNAVTTGAALRDQRHNSTYASTSTSRPLCRPWDRGDVLRRLATFKSMTWFGKPQVAGPVACARRGWINVDVDLLACEGCGAHLSFVLPPAPWSRTQADAAAEAFAEQLDSGHKALCAWKGNACSDALTLFPPSPPTALVGGFQDRCEGLLQLSALLVISGSAIETFKLLRGSQIESLLAQHPRPVATGLQYVNELQATGAESGDKSENGYSYDGFYQSQRLIALCGWEPRVLPYTVDYEEGPAPSSKIIQSGGPCDAVTSRKSRDPGPSVLLVSKGDAGEENTETGLNKATKYDPASAVLDCCLCRASVGLWGFSTNKGSAQRHMHHQYFQIKQQLLHHQSSSSHRGLAVATSCALAPGTYLPDSTSFTALTVPPKVSTIARPPAIAYRPIRPSDLEVLQDVHEAFFPIKYELEFFANVVHGHGIISWAAVDTNRSNEQSDELIGFVTARVVAAEDSEEVDMLGYELVNSERTLIYILTLGVIKQYRNLGIASALVGKVIQYALSLPTCRAVYLHVISYNNSAIYFYKKNSFQCLRRLHNFYYINGHHYDSYLYIYFVNGGRSPCSAIDMLSTASSFVRSLFTSLLSRFFWKSETGRLKWLKCHEVCRPLSSSSNHHLTGPDTSCV